MKENNLNEAQKHAVESTEGPVMILAGAGSGKTRTLISRIIYLLEVKKIPSYKILALTFSNKAAKEMQERIEAQANENFNSLQISTFHSFCARILRQKADFLGLSRNFTIYDTAESKAVIRDILMQYGINLKEQSPFEVLSFINSIKDKGYYPGRKNRDDGVDTNNPFYPFYRDYEVILTNANALDFGGLLTGVLQLFEKFPQVLQYYQNRFEYVLIDEYQDTNRAQFELITMLCGKNKNICVVGDEDQSIYSWRGADINNILDFERYFPNAKIIKLEQNYRSSKNIIEAANCVIEKNSQRKGKKLWTSNQKGDVISVMECSQDSKESEYITRQISLLASKGIEYRDIAVFYRTNIQSRLIEDSLRRRNIPYRVVGGIKFYERKEIKDLLAYMRLVINDQDTLALGRIINTPHRGIGTITLKKLETQANRQGVSLWNMLENWGKKATLPEELNLSVKIKRDLLKFITLILKAKKMEKNGAVPSDIYRLLLDESGYKSILERHKDYESIAKLENLEEMLSAVKQFENEAENPTLVGFLESISLDNLVGTVKSREIKKGGEVSLMTIHGAKGLEFSHVFISGMEENVFPSYQSLESGHLIEEERRLFYVAMTRAMKKLYISFAQGRMFFGQLRFNGPSRFLEEIPDRFYVMKKMDSQETPSLEIKRRSKVKKNFLFPRPNLSNSMVKKQKSKLRTSSYKLKYGKKSFRVGANVEHGMYGRGKILQCKGNGDDQKVLIDFTGGEKKFFLLKYAPLNLIEEWDGQDR